MKFARLTVRRCGHLALAAFGLVACLTGGGAGHAWAIPDQPERLDFGGLVRTYSLHVPAGLEHPAGLVVNLHGAGATGRDQEAATNYDAVADAHGFIVVYPDGIDFSWADGRGPSQPDRQGIDDVGFITTLAGKLVADFGVDPGHVFATGMSAGAFMVNRLACERADVFAAIAPVAGTLGVNAGCTPSRPVSVLATHGTADPIVPFDGGGMNGRGGPSVIVSAPEMVARWRQADGCQDGPVCAAGTAVVLKQIDGGGHVWPGDASDASWQFFAAHSR
jgi:polyhydroxybutyrate depolymerase